MKVKGRVTTEGLPNGQIQVNETLVWRYTYGTSLPFLSKAFPYRDRKFEIPQEGSEFC
jgi:hypothetical protein